MRGSSRRSIPIAVRQPSGQYSLDEIRKIKDRMKQNEDNKMDSEEQK